MSTNVLKERAKRLAPAIKAMFGHDVTRGQALELVAHEENFPNWDAASACARSKSPIENLGGISALSLIADPKPFGLFVTGASGTGKTFQVLQMILSHVQAGIPVIVVDRGATYLKLVETLGGRFVKAEPAGGNTERRFGETPVVVIDCGAVPVQSHADTMLTLPTIESSTKPPLIVVDEAWYALKVFSNLVVEVGKLVSAGSSFCVVGQHAEDIAAFTGMRVRSIKMSLAR